MASRINSSPLVYSSRFEIPPPVDSRQKLSDNHGGIPERLSKTNIQELMALIIKSLSSRGAERRGEMFGSTRERLTRPR